MIYFSPLEQFEVVLFKEIIIFGIDVSITNATVYLFTVFMVIFSFLIFSLFNAGFFGNSWLFVSESLYKFVASLIRQQTGVVGYEYLPLFFSTFLFILVSNLIGLFPLGYTMTGHILITFTLAFSFNFGFILLGFQKQGFSFLKLFVPKDAPLMFKPLIIVIEVVSYLLRTFSLSIRLFANMMAGHTLLHILASFCFVGGIFSIFPWLLVFAISALEFAIAFIQTYVFTVLLCIYLNDALNGAKH